MGGVLCYNTFPTPMVTTLIRGRSIYRSSQVVLTSQNGNIKEDMGVVLMQLQNYCFQCQLKRWSIKKRNKKIVDQLMHRLNEWMIKNDEKLTRWGGVPINIAI